MERRVFIQPETIAALVNGRLLFAGVVALLAIAVLVVRYSHLQIERHHDFVTRADNNRIQVRQVAPPRGLIFDRNGLLLAENRPSYSLSVVVQRAGDIDALLAKIAQIVPLSQTEISAFRKSARRAAPYQPVSLKYRLSEAEHARLAVAEHQLDGVEITAQPLRHYPLGEAFAHVVGYVGKINDREAATLDPSHYAAIDSIGKSGVERYYESLLLGEHGREQVETDARGRVMQLLAREEPTPGANLMLSLDARLQLQAYQLLDGQRGALVAIDIASGGVLAMASTPSFDPNAFVTGISHNQYNALINSPDKPMFDRALRGQYPPGSTIKPLFGLVALQEQVIDQHYTIEDNGFFSLPNVERPWRDWNYKTGGHGSRVDLAEAIIESCDVFFYDVSIKTGIDALAAYGEKFALGIKTGIDLPGEAAGIMPSAQWKRQRLNTAWFDGDTINASIGQGFFLTTPLQLAVMTARIASRGDLVTPFVVDASNGVQFDHPHQQIEIAKPHWDYLHRAMQDVIEGQHGTARGIATDGYTIAGKTGTAQVISIAADEQYDRDELDQRQRDHALFVAFAPVQQPRIAIALIVENGEHGSSVAAPIARALLDHYMALYPAPSTVAGG
ncbi:penicillin-binding protein 2 [Gammaproteobacteria bacterium LSUCC0057]|uniref:Peptidoglycan D,D-transpeptidase MrdA n=1 Tax=Gammaproteobacteria bacterium LSUCC0057 TaxID=2559237 RepID=A0A4Y8UHZ0_9GAMM|nr:penicillin-binding protein 2 [Gammaproteobacteria bacterium LSUCC0057]